ncbi:SHOCT domain-containing protein [Clostridium sp. WILCCON 0269]|uniref:SHOCT domain-containing protein n=1 Tax=Candidatus Clostridium eludens TaxID=3381663 RepID=A0ABW8SIX8_9CLOT
MNENYINYLLSVHILKDLKDKNIITEEEFAAIDDENKKCFKPKENQWFNLISVQNNYNMNVQ